ncbi:MAG TPA: hypothetical protein VF070_14095 [Streptosporangiaceae bacterium]
MTNKDQKAAIHQRMAATGEPYAEARRKVIEARSRRPSAAEPEKIYVNYIYTRYGKLEFDAAAWTNALSNERQRMVEQAVGEEFDNDFGLYGGQGIAECIDSGELEYTTSTQAQMDAEWDAEAIETAVRAYAGIEEHDEWPGGVPRPVPRDSYVVRHQDVEYVVLRNQRTIVAVIDIDDGSYTVLKSWPKEIEAR